MSEQAAEHVQIPNTKHNTKHEHVFVSEHRTALFGSPGKNIKSDPHRKRCQARVLELLGDGRQELGSLRTPLGVHGRFFLQQRWVERLGKQVLGESRNHSTTMWKVDSATTTNDTHNEVLVPHSWGMQA